MCFFVFTYLVALGWYRLCVVAPALLVAQRGSVVAFRGVLDWQRNPP